MKGFRQTSLEVIWLKIKKGKFKDPYLRYHIYNFVVGHKYCKNPVREVQNKRLRVLI